MLGDRSSIGTVRQAVEKYEGRTICLPDSPPEMKPAELVSTSQPTMEAEATYALPSPTGTPYRTPSSSRSRQTSRQTSRTYEDNSPATTPPPLPFDVRITSRSRNSKRSDESMNTALDETLPLSDPRRFTPTLHASLISEILSLRRDVENKTNDIERLEQGLHNAQSQNEQLNANVLAANREARQVKRQMQILEGGTLSAINELAKERDDAINDLSDLRRRFEQNQEKAKSQEDFADRLQDQLHKDKETWNAEKRSLETKIHIVEGRLKVVLSEVAKAQQLQATDESNYTPKRSQSRQSGLGSPTKRPTSITARRQSGNSVVSDQVCGRTSVLSFTHVDHLNLADELALEDIDEDYASPPEDGRLSPDVPPHDPRPSSRISMKARKLLGLPIDSNELDTPDRNIFPDTSRNQSAAELTQSIIPSHYVDTGVQYTPPPSPVAERNLETPIPRARESLDTPSGRASKTLSIISEASANYSVDTSDNAWEENLRNQPIMVSAACQTTEQLPSPSLTARSGSGLYTVTETSETREIAVQTELPIFAPTPSRLAHHRTDTVETSTSDSTELQIPTIAIIPPTSRPVTPEESAVKLPPRTKNVSCQVETHVLCDYHSKGVQTEEIRIDKRSMAPPTVPPPPMPVNAPPPSSFKPKNMLFTRRNAPNAANSSMRRSSMQALPPINDDGPLSDGSRTDMVRPIRSSSMFAGFDETEEVSEAEDDIFQDDDFFNRPTTKFVLSGGKVMSSEKLVDSTEETDAARAGRRIALDNIRRSEDGIQPDPKDLEREIESMPKSIQRQSSKHVRRTPSGKAGNMRRIALISSGTSVHQSKQSVGSSASGASSGAPPVPIPVRYSSARVGKSISDGGRSSRGSSNTSPTRNVRRVPKPPLRKARSGPAISPAGPASRKGRSQSPPFDKRVSIVPEMPSLSRSPERKVLKPAISLASVRNEVGAPRPSIAQGPNRPTTHVRQNSDAFDVQQTSVVDAIAQTMVGEWMFKYVRRRKSFGKLDKDWDPTKSVDELTINTSTGIRHKRWVWLAPYEKSVMWSSKQPTDGNSLLGKSGRKLTIKSVLDVKDDNPLPKGSAPGPHFNRSILILTPQRALKFTATTQERHYVWLTALSFLSHSPISMNDLAPAPPALPNVPGDITGSPTVSLAGSLRRRPIRDSIRLAKGFNRQPAFRSFTADGIVTMTEYDRPATQEAYDPINDPAMPPVVRRYHTRNRSNTAPKPVTSAFRALLMREPVPPPTATPSVTLTSEKASIDRGPLTPSLGMPSIPSSRRGSEASIGGRPNFGNSDFNSKYYDSTSNSSHAATMAMKVDVFLAEQQRNGRSQPARGPLRNLRLARPSMRNLRDPMISSWVQSDGNLRGGMSPVETNSLHSPIEQSF